MSTAQDRIWLIGIHAISSGSYSPSKETTGVLRDYLKESRDSRQHKTSMMHMVTCLECPTSVRPELVFPGHIKNLQIQRWRSCFDSSSITRRRDVRMPRLNAPQISGPHRLACRHSQISGLSAANGYQASPYIGDSSESADVFPNHCPPKPLMKQSKRFGLS